MRKAILALLVVSIAAAAGCGGSSEQSAPPTESATAKKKLSSEEKPAYIPDANPYGRLSLAMLDTLRQLKAKYEITRDEYWDDEGGVLANDYLEVWYPEGTVTVTHGMRVFMEIMPARQKFAKFFGRAPEVPLVVRIPPHMEHYKEETGRDWWYYADLRSDSLTFQPLYVLVKRNLISIAVPHEYYQWALGRITNYGAPRWLEEGVASYLSDEGNLLAIQVREFPEESWVMAPAVVDETLVMEETKQAARIAYYNAFRMVQHLVDSYGEDKLKGLVLALGEGASIDDACRRTFDTGYDDLLDAIAEQPGEI